MTKDLRTVRKLLDRGAACNPVSDDGFPLLLTAAGLPGGEEISELLLARGADPNKPGPEGLTPLILAAGLGRERLVAALLSKEADPNAVSGGGMTALWTTTDARITRRLLAAGASPDSRRAKDGSTPLIDAACSGQFERARELLAGAADPSLKDAAGQTASACAAARSHAEIAVYILAQQGQRDAQYALGLQYEAGYLGLERDQARAYAYFILAARQGEKSSAAKAKKLAGKMRRKDFVRANNFLEDWKPASR